MNDTLPDHLVPDHLAIDPHSRFHDAQALSRGVGVRFNGVERDNVEEYSISEGWIKVQVGKSRDRRGNPMTIKIKVAAYHLDTQPTTAMRLDRRHTNRYWLST